MLLIYVFQKLYEIPKNVIGNGISNNSNYHLKMFVTEIIRFP